MQGTRYPVTVGKLIDRLSVFPKDAELLFGGSVDGLSFYRIKSRGENLVQLEFNEDVDRNKSGEMVAIEA